MPPYNTPSYHPTSPTSHGLPSDEYKYLKRQQEKSRLEWHLAKKHLLPRASSSPSYASSSSFPSFPSSSSSSSSAPPCPPTPYQQRNLPHAHRVQTSAVKSATRKALASVLDSAYDGVCDAWPQGRRHGHSVRGGVGSRRDVDEYYERTRAREMRASGESMWVGYHSMEGYGRGEGVGGPRLGSKFSFDSLDGA